MKCATQNSPRFSRNWDFHGGGRGEEDCVSKAALHDWGWWYVLAASYNELWYMWVHTLVKTNTWAYNEPPLWLSKNTLRRKQQYTSSEIFLEPWWWLCAACCCYYSFYSIINYSPLLLFIISMIEKNIIRLWRSFICSSSSSRNIIILI